MQLDLIVNRAGWHDPQARINVLTARVRRLQGRRPGLTRISPVISDSEEPFFFRALSGECIEFRHTNELPKELELDDFQVKTPTDTIGQHIHLVKFDVTSSDGSGNGWNYEDGTFAPDEIASRLCAWDRGDAAEGRGISRPAEKTRADMTARRGARGRADGTALAATGTWLPSTDIWRLERSQRPDLFQTTTQRWFADPILSARRRGRRAVDRTMRTVFTHDHFGPSSIQQHGFYAALVIEPPARLVCPPERRTGPAIDLTEAELVSRSSRRCAAIWKRPRRRPGSTSVAWGGKAWEGARKRMCPATADGAAEDPPTSSIPTTANSCCRIADFALLYDPRDRERQASTWPSNLTRSPVGWRAWRSSIARPTGATRLRLLGTCLRHASPSQERHRQLLLSRRRPPRPSWPPGPSATMHTAASTQAISSADMLQTTQTRCSRPRRPSHRVPPEGGRHWTPEDGEVDAEWPSRCAAGAARVDLGRPPRSLSRQLPRRPDPAQDRHQGEASADDCAPKLQLNRPGQSGPSDGGVRARPDSFECSSVAHTAGRDGATWAWPSSGASMATRKPRCWRPSRANGW